VSRVTNWLTVASVLVVSSACAQLPQAGSGKDEVPVESLTKTSSVPAEWGRLVAVSEVTSSTNTSLLWFQDDSGGLHLVGFDRDRRQLWPQAAHIRRDRR
jgi:hypothetical protein